MLLDDLAPFGDRLGKVREYLPDASNEAGSVVGLPRAPEPSTPHLREGSQHRPYLL